MSPTHERNETPVSRRTALAAGLASLAALTLPGCAESTTTQENARLGMAVHVTKDQNSSVPKRICLEFYNTGNYHLEIFKDEQSVHQADVKVVEEVFKHTIEKDLEALSGHSGSISLIIVREEQNNYPSRVQLIKIK